MRRGETRINVRFSPISFMISKQRESDLLDAVLLVVSHGLLHFGEDLHKGRQRTERRRLLESRRDGDLPAHGSLRGVR